MPLPRFERLDAASKASILDAARGCFAQDGREATTLQGVAEAAGISRSAVYNYFDGKDDLFDAVCADSISQLTNALGAWLPVHDADSLWQQFAAAQDGLLAFLSAQPHHRVVLATNQEQAANSSTWVSEFFSNAVELSLVDLAPGRALLERATAAVLAAADSAELTSKDPVRASGASELVRRLWGEPRP